jgi:uncharacterized Ntn-hydrolase superfamily protein
MNTTDRPIAVAPCLLILARRAVVRILAPALPAVALALAAAGGSSAAHAAPPDPATFSIVAADPEAGEVGVAVASRFFAVGSVVPFAKAGVGAVATQANANTTFGPRGLDLMERGLGAEEVVRVLLRADGDEARQVGVVTAAGDSATSTGPKCNAWAGGRHGPGYAVQGNILAGEPVVAAMEKAFVDSKGKRLAERLYAAIVAGDAAGGDSRGHQSAALVVTRAGGGFNGFSDRAIDLRVDDHADPVGELGRLLGMSLVNDDWNRGWAAFTAKKYPEALRAQERAAAGAEKQPGMLPEVLYDLAVVRAANGDRDGALHALTRALALNPKLRKQADGDPDLASLRPFPK